MLFSLDLEIGDVVRTMCVGEGVLQRSGATSEEEVRRWCTNHHDEPEPFIQAAAIAAGWRLPACLEARGATPPHFGELAAACASRFRSDLLHMLARWIVQHVDATDRRAFLRDTVAAAACGGVSRDLACWRMEVGRAIQAAAPEVALGVACCLRRGLTPADLREIATLSAEDQVECVRLAECRQDVLRQVRKRRRRRPS